MCLSLTVGLWARNWMFPNVSRDRQETSITVITVVVKLVLGSSFSFQFSVLTHSRKGPHTGKAAACSRGSHAHTYTQIDRHTHTHTHTESMSLLLEMKKQRKKEKTLLWDMFSACLCSHCSWKLGCTWRKWGEHLRGGIHWVVGKGPVLLTVCVFALFTVPSLACSRSVHWNHTSWNIFHHFALTVDGEKKQHEHNSKEAETFRLSLTQPGEPVSAILTEFSYSRWILKRKGIGSNFYCISKYINKIETNKTPSFQLRMRWGRGIDF